MATKSKTSKRYAEHKAADKKSLSAKVKSKAPVRRKATGRLTVNKTYKLYINGKFPRTESGRYIDIHDASGNLVANICRASRKDFREAVVAARGAQKGWAGASAYLRGQILYRISEMLEGRADQFVTELMVAGLTKRGAQKDVTAAIDSLVYYAGWADKYQQLFSSVNPVSSSHFNFSILEPMGVVGVLPPTDGYLNKFVSDISPLITGGNAVIALAPEVASLAAVSFAEVLHSSDVPPGVVNILSGYRSELAEHFASHMDVNAVVYNGEDTDELKIVEKLSAHNIKRVIVQKRDAKPDPYQIAQAQETKTTWHPIGN